ncbi:hypothetical protein RJ640_010856 [Escallonia rubra]|uniref:Uncharacterized protein n=1 Tax=Escallonia rubra TaxID=112253 RepID=A0AA88S4L2_9ASTE|nr:hypothetical protein RJ640_010856 [Escallonia rubra]
MAVKFFVLSSAPNTISQLNELVANFPIIPVNQLDVLFCPGFDGAEVIRTVRHKKGKWGGMAIKMDLEKRIKESTIYIKNSLANHMWLSVLVAWSPLTLGREAKNVTEPLAQIPFSMILKHPGDENSEKFFETFHGANISIQYLASVDVLRGYLHKSLSATVEFILESEKGTASLVERPLSPETVIFYITQDTQRHSLLPELKSGGFRVAGKICTQCSLTDPLCGELTVEASVLPVHSIDIHLFRVESILVGEKIVTESSLIQTTQACNIADGDVCHNISLPIYIILPRLLTCPTIFAGPFSIEFKATIVITFQSELSKLHPKSDPKTPRQWLSAVSNIVAIQISAGNGNCTLGIGTDEVRVSVLYVSRVGSSSVFKRHAKGVEMGRPMSWKRWSSAALWETVRRACSSSVSVGRRERKPGSNGATFPVAAVDHIDREGQSYESESC